MTVVVAARSTNGTLLAADSCTTVNDRKLVQLVNGSKLVRFEHFIVGMAGHGPVRDVLDILLYEPLPVEDEGDDEYYWGTHKLDHMVEVHRFLEKFCEVYETKADVEQLESVELLYITPDRIWCSQGDATVHEVRDYWAIGSGSDYALATLYNFYDRADPRVAMTKAVQTACHFAVGCEVPIDWEEMTHGVR